MALHSLKLVALSFLAATLVVLASWTSIFDQVNNNAYDWTQRVAGGLELESDVLIVAIDEASLDQFGGWPWPHDVLADLVRGVSAGRPAVIGLDILLDDPTGPEADRELADALLESGRVILAARVDDSDSTAGWLMPLPDYRQGARGLAHVHADPDLDSVMRRIVTAKHAGGRVLSALSVGVLKAVGGLPEGYEEDLGGSVRIFPEEVMIRFAGDRGTFPRVSAWEVLEGDVDAAQFEDRIVLVGTTAEGLGDDWMTPASVSQRRMPGVEIHANAIESIYSGRSVGEVPSWIVLLALAALILGLRWVERRFEGFRFYVVSLATLPAIVVVSWFLMEMSVWLPFPTLFFGVALVVPTLGFRKLARLNRNLDEKISRLSDWAAESTSAPSPLSSVREQLEGELEDEDLKKRWLGILESFENERQGRKERRERLVATRRHNASWKLDAVDFFNEQLYRFKSFNDAVLIGIEDVIIVSDPAGQVVSQNTAARGLEAFSDNPPALWDYLSSLLDGRPLIEAVAVVIASEETTRVETIPSSSASRYYTLTLSPISDLGVVATLHDVTAQRELDQAKNDMVSLVSHELRTPLTSIRGYGDMLAKYGLVEEKGQDFLQSILDESARLNELIQSFLDVASIESGRRQLDLTEFEIEPLVDDLLSSLRSVAQYKKIALENAIKGEAGLMRADRVLIYQALANLISNSIKYSADQTLVRVELDRDDGVICFRVEDQGYGIPADDSRRIFEKFYRRSNDETRAESGFGLGLPFVRQVAEQHGGGVGVESEVGKGSVFSFWIPSS